MQLVFIYIIFIFNALCIYRKIRCLVKTKNFLKILRQIESYVTYMKH
jgi:hypothetical protein